jgi:uncharacterized membrane protein
MSATKSISEVHDQSALKPPVLVAEQRRSERVATIDWMRGLVMVLMILDHASMAFDAGHIDHDSAMFPDATTMALPGSEFFPRWLAHLCAASFVFLMGTSLALSVERKVIKGVGAWEIDKGILMRGLVIALLDLTFISFGSGKWVFGVLMAIGVSMMCMTLLRRLPTWALLTAAGGWIVMGELVSGLVWSPPGNSSKLAAFLVANYSSPTIIFKYPIIPWLAVTICGWVFGRHLIRYASGLSKISGKKVLWICGVVSLAVFAVVRSINGYGNMFLHRADNSWQQWLHVSKYPPSLAYYSLELGLLFLCLAFLRAIELRIGVRENGVFYVFGQTALFFYLVHRLAFETPATYFGLRGFDGLPAAYGAAAVMLMLLYPMCRWYRSLKAARPKSLLRYV